VFFRVGFDLRQKGHVDPRTGERFLTGTYPTKAGVGGALRYVTTDPVEVRVYGKPAWDVKKRTSRPPDALGNAYTTFLLPKSELETALSGAGTIEEVILQMGSYEFKQVLSVWVAEA
jgi:hypothetical protein